jgi:cell wall-associated NlpC family hydrolase
MTETTQSRLRRLPKQAATTSVILFSLMFAAPGFARETIANSNANPDQRTSVTDEFSATALSDAQALLDLTNGQNAMVAGKTQDSSRIQKLLAGAMALIGTPYRWGGTSTNGFDCSGLVGYVFRNALGINLPRVSRDIAHEGKAVSRSELIKGDLVFFSKGRVIDHVGIYVGEGKFLHAPRTGRDVTISKLEGYWGARLVSARRIAVEG